MPRLPLMFVVGGMPIFSPVDGAEAQEVRSRFPSRRMKRVRLPWVALGCEIDVEDLGGRLSDLSDEGLEHYIRWRDEHCPEPFRVQCQRARKWCRDMEDRKRRKAVLSELAERGDDPLLRDHWSMIDAPDPVYRDRHGRRA